MKNTSKLCDAVKFSDEHCPLKVGVHILGIGFVVPQKAMKVYKNYCVIFWRGILPTEFVKVSNVRGGFIFDGGPGVVVSCCEMPSLICQMSCTVQGGQCNALYGNGRQSFFTTSFLS